MGTRVLLGRSILLLGLYVALASVVLVATGRTVRGASIAGDDFNRAASDSLGVTPVGGYAWFETENAAGTISLIDVSGDGKAQFASRGNATDPVAMLGVGAADVDISVTMRSFHTASDNYFGGVRYRSPVPSAGFSSDGNPVTGGYGVFVTQGVWGAAPYTSADMIGLAYANGVVASVVLSNAIASNTDYVLRVVASGDSHQVYWNGDLVIDYTETNVGRDYTGGVGLGTYYGNWQFDNLSIEEVVVPEPVGLALLLTGLPALVMFKRMRSMRCPTLVGD